MMLQTLFEKPLDRAIEGVIKADDVASLRLEIEEYVLTNEVEKRLEDFLDAYNNYEVANGVWISGFFGSGKSHLLKMLALLLENRETQGVRALDLFLPKCGDNEILRADLKRAVAIPSRSILFNIDQKADVISKTQIDALLAVFVKVFDDMCGYYGKQGHIAQFERDLDSRGLYAAFQAAYADVAGRSWQRGREQALLEARNIASAYAQATGAEESDALGILDRYRSEYRVSIEDFAEKVKDYVERQGADFRLNFFVDEVGQYIAENVKLMTNLQTIAESLATKCRGRAWVIVTAQEDMNTVVGEMSRQQGNDFSKIQARFANRMKLTSADVAEVIQKRLLMKNASGVERLSVIYHEQCNNFKTLFDFADGSATYRNFQDRDHFVHSYPFIPYQFALFQSAIINLSLHNAFEGKHSSVGERSMLGVFQQVAIHIGQHDIGSLATFDLMFEGIRAALKANLQRAIIQAEQHLDNPLATRILKALFLVKYVKEFKSTARNISVLMLAAFNQDPRQLRQDVDEALNLLEQQTYIQRNGELFEYLTDQEKDVEQEIKNTDVESGEVAAELDRIVFDHVMRVRKIRHGVNGQDYPYSRKLDDRLHGREYELAIHIVSPFHEHAGNDTILRMQSMGRDELVVLMPPDERLVRDLLMYKRTEKYIRQTVSMAQQDGMKRILEGKAAQNRELYGALQQRVQALLGEARLLLAGGDVESGSENALARITQGFHALIDRAYPNLRMLGAHHYSEEQVKRILTATQGTLEEVASLSEPEQELLAAIRGNHRNSLRTTLKLLVETFERKPYGWPYPALLCTLAQLCARGKLEARLDGNPLEGEALERAMRNAQAQANLVLEPQLEFSAAQVRALKTFYEDFFDAPPQGNEARALGQETATALRALVRELEPLAAQHAQYPFLAALTPAIDRLKALTGKPYAWYLTELGREEDALLDLKEGVIDPIRKVMNGPHKAILDEARRFMQRQESNFLYVEGSEPEALKALLNDAACYKGNCIQQIKTRLEQLRERLDALVRQRRAEAVEALEAMRERMRGMDEYRALPDVRQADLDKPYQDLIDHLGEQSLIAVINDRLRYFEEQGYQKVLARMVELAAPRPRPLPDAEADTDEAPARIAEPSIECIPSRQIRVPYNKAWLADETDVERYLAAMREALLGEIRKGRRIQV